MSVLGTARVAYATAHWKARKEQPRPRFVAWPLTILCDIFPGFAMLCIVCILRQFCLKFLHIVSFCTFWIAYFVVLGSAKGNVSVVLFPGDLCSRFRCALFCAFGIPCNVFPRIEKIRHIYCVELFVQIPVLIFCTPRVVCDISLASAKDTVCVIVLFRSYLCAQFLDALPF